MEVLSHALMKLYEAAAHVPLADFSGEALHILESLVHFDGAILATAECDAHRNGNGDAGSMSGEINLLQGYAKLAAINPPARPIGIGLNIPLNCGCTWLYHYCAPLAAKNLESQPIVLRLNLLRDLSLEDAPVKWLALFRSGEDSFSTEDRERLNLVWPHLVFAHSINCRSELSRFNEQVVSRAMALASDTGRIIAADPQFIALLRLEWPDSQGKNLPSPILVNWKRGQKFYGSRIEIALRAHSNYICCTAALRSMVTIDLTEAERIVVQLFAAGLSNKKIAEQLGVSNNTVRSHIASAYSKLHVHDKAELAQLLGCPTCSAVSLHSRTNTLMRPLA